MPELSNPNVGFVTDDYVFFLGGIFSQWKPARFVDSGITYYTAEHYMMYHKLLTLGYPLEAEAILLNSNPSAAKRAGRNAKATQESLDAWDAVKFDVVVAGSFLKFSQNPGMGKQMLDLLPRKFVEASPYDRVWGIGLDISNPDIRDPKNWRGQNLLGRALDSAAVMLKEME